MGGGTSRQSYEEYVNKRRSKELLFHDEANINTYHHTKAKWGHRLSIPSLNNGGSASVNSSIETLPNHKKARKTMSKSFALNPKHKKKEILESPLSEDEDGMVIMDTPKHVESSPPSDDNYAYKPKYALVRRRSKNSDATRTTIKKLQ